MPETSEPHLPGRKLSVGSPFSAHWPSHQTAFLTVLGLGSEHGGRGRWGSCSNSQDWRLDIYNQTQRLLSVLLPTEIFRLNRP